MKTTQPSLDIAIEYRQEYRLQNQLIVFLELRAATSDAPATIVICHSIDISTNGLRVIADHHLENGCILRACLQTQDHSKKFMLVAEVKWAQPTEEPEAFLVGLALFESEDTDIQAWKEFLAREYTRGDRP